MKERIMPYRVLVVDFADNVPHVEIDQAELMERKGRRARFRFDRRQVSASTLIIELAKKYPVRDISVEEPEIEAIVREIYEHSTIVERLGGQGLFSSG
jgi:ABC-2 type transport system ATP-binding protein